VIRVHWRPKEGAGAVLEIREDHHPMDVCEHVRSLLFKHEQLRADLVFQEIMTARRRTSMSVN